MSQFKRFQVFKYLTLGFVLAFSSTVFADEGPGFLSEKYLPRASWRSASLVRTSQAAAGIHQNVPPPTCGVSAYQVRYRSVMDPHSEPLSALVQVPNCPNKYDLPVLLYNHATRIQHTDAPSTQPLDPEAWATAVLFASYGFVVALPDYRGLGLSKGRQQYLTRKTGTDDVYSLLKALVGFASLHKINFSGELFIGGYSQGAHVTLAALQKFEVTDIQPFHMVGAAALSGVYGLDSVALDSVLKNGNNAHCVFVIMAVLTETNLRKNDLPPADEILKKEWIPVGEDLLSGGISFREAMKKLPAKPAQLFNEDFLEKMYREREKNALVRILAEESVDRSALRTPVLVYAAKSDEIASADGARLLAKRLKDLKTPVTLLINPEKISHMEASLPAFLQTRQYFSELSTQASQLLGTTFAPLKY